MLKYFLESEYIHNDFVNNAVNIHPAQKILLEQG